MVGTGGVVSTCGTGSREQRLPSRLSIALIIDLIFLPLMPSCVTRDATSFFKRPELVREPPALWPDLLRDPLGRPIEDLKIEYPLATKHQQTQQRNM